MIIDIFHDTVCPWCKIGKKNLFEAISKWEQQKLQKVDIHWHPFLLNDSIPPSGYEYRSFMMERKGLSAEELQNLFDYVQNVGAAIGVKLDFNKIPLAVNTKLSHLLISLAPFNVKNDIVDAIHKAYFEDGLNISDVETLVSIGAAHNMDANQIKLQLSYDSPLLETIASESQAARFNGINSVPFFIINKKIPISGGHPVDTFLQAFEQAA